MFACFAMLFQRNRVLALWNWLHVALLVFALSMAAFDARGILGINPWNKPLRFLISMTMLLWTLARLGAYLSGRAWTVQMICWSKSLVLLGVIACVSLQATLGTPFNTFVSLTRGVTMSISAMLMLQLLVLFYVTNVMLPRMYLWRIRIGLVVFLLSSWRGGMIVSLGLPLAVLVLIVTRRKGQFIKSPLGLFHHSRVATRPVHLGNEPFLEGNKSWQCKVCNAKV
jgi:hypothetical protein